MKCSIIIPSFHQRLHLLKWNLLSLSKQTIPFDYEIILLNDGTQNDGHEELVKQYENKLNINYIWSGKRNVGGVVKWRIPGFAINIGLKKSTGDVCILCCAEMFHVGNTIKEMVLPFDNNRKIITIPDGRHDTHNTFLPHLERIGVERESDINLWNNAGWLNNKLPFLMGFDRQQFFDMGGYDEDFTGMSYDDNDIVDRFLDSGNVFFQTGAKTIHLYHPHHPNRGSLQPNLNLYKQRKGIIKRNAGREWGVL